MSDRGGSARSLALSCLGLAAAVAVVFHGALGLFFSQDDFAGLARAHGQLPRLAGPWRYVSGQAYFDVMRRVAGLEPMPYHAASLIAHLAVAVLLLLFLRRHVGPAAAWLGATFFAVHPALFTALYSISGIGEILALGFGLAALLAVRAAGRRRWSALPSFALSLLSKESTLLLPVAALAEPGARRRDPMNAALGAAAALYLVLFLAVDVFGVRRTLAEQEAYRLAFDATLMRNLLSYLGWTVNFLLATVRGVSDVADPGVFPYGVAALLLWGAGTMVRGLRERGWIAGGVMFACFLIPVLPLRNHTYHYYLYAPLAGAAWCVAAALDLGFAWLAATRGGAGSRQARRRHGKAGPWPAPLRDTRDDVRPREPAAAPRPGLLATGAALALGALLTWNGALLVEKIETYPFIDLALRADPTVDRARIAANVHADLAIAGVPPRAHLRFWSPSSIERDRAAGRDTTRETYWEQNVRNALMDGLAVKVLFPQVGEVEFVRAFRPDDNSGFYALYGLDGHVELRRASELDSLRRAALGIP